MKTLVYFRPSGAIQQVSTGPDEIADTEIPGLSLLVLSGAADVEGKIVVGGTLVDGAIDDRSPSDKLRELQNAARSHLAASDWVVARAYERQETVPQQWVTYRETLRNIIRMTEYQDVAMPIRPA